MEKKCEIIWKIEENCEMIWKIWKKIVKRYGKCEKICNLLFFHIFHIVHISAYFSSIFSISFHSSTYFSSIFFISFGKYTRKVS
jgi:hypothetical protein